MNASFRKKSEVLANLLNQMPYHRNMYDSLEVSSDIEAYDYFYKPEDADIGLKSSEWRAELLYDSKDTIQELEDFEYRLNDDDCYACSSLRIINDRFNDTYIWDIGDDEPYQI